MRPPSTLAVLAAALALGGCGLLGGSGGPAGTGSSSTGGAAPGAAAAGTPPGPGARTAAGGANPSRLNPLTTLCNSPCTDPIPMRAAPPGSRLPAVMAMPAGSPAHVQQVVAAFLAGVMRSRAAATPASQQTVIGGWRSPLAAVRGFATTYVNWTWQTIADRLRLLAAASVGQARSAMALAASGAAGDYELQHGQVSNSGTIETIGPLTGHPRQYAVVTRERTTAAAGNEYAGLQPSWHVSVATVTPVQDGLWVLSAWQPEN
jgi:hypothetical protein